MSNELVRANTALHKISSGKQVNQDAWMTMWCNTNWGELLQPAPLSIALLGSILIIASNTDDFSILTERDISDTPPTTWEYAKFPNSFKTCLQQMVGEGYTAFEGAHHDMTRILNATSQMPQAISTAVMLIMTGSPDEIRVHLESQIKAVLKLSAICQDAASHCEGVFKDISGLAQELVLGCTHKVGTAEQILEANKTHLEVLSIQKEYQEKIIKDAEDATTNMKSSFIKADEAFHSSVQNLPTGMELAGMNTLESLNKVLSSAASIGLSMASMSAGIRPTIDNNGERSISRDMLNTQSPVGISSAGNSQALLDPGITEAQRVLSAITTIQDLMVGGEDGKPNWDCVSPRSGGEKTSSGGTFVKYELQTIRDGLRSTKDKEISKQVIEACDAALKVIDAMIKKARSVDQPDNAFDEYKPKVQQLKVTLQQLVTVSNLLLNQTGATANGPATPVPPANANSSAAQLAVENARFQVDQTRGNLNAARGSYEKAADRLIENQKEITETIAKMTSLKLANGGLSKMLPVLKSAVVAFTKLRAQFSQLSQLFISVASLLTDVMTPSVDAWANSIKDTGTAKLGGVSLGDFTRQMIYTQMMVPLRVSMLAEKIAETYLKVSNEYIMPAQRSVGNLLQFSQDTSPDGRAVMRAKLEMSQKMLQEQCERSSKEISALVDEDRKKFSANIESRLDTIVTAVAPAIPAIGQPVPAAIASITEAHIRDYQISKSHEAAAKEYVLDDLM